jgi:hypothetical protein
MEFLYKARNIEISYDPKYQYMYCNWIGFQNEESIIKSGMIILDLFRKHGYTKLLNDNSDVTGPWQEAAEWTSTFWFPQMINAGLRHFAWVFSPNIFAALSAKKAMPVTDIVRSFKTYEEARDWLIMQK